jgi:hypothetical protein
MGQTRSQGGQAFPFAMQWQRCWASAGCHVRPRHVTNISPKSQVDLCFQYIPIEISENIFKQRLMIFHDIS